MFKKAFLTAVATATLALGSTQFAGATTLDLPEAAPVPVWRADALRAASLAEVRHLPVVSIATTAQVIPEARQNVRLVGVRFLPDQAGALALNAPRRSTGGWLASMEAASVGVLKSVSTTLFGEAVAAEDEVVASLNEG